MRASLRMWMSSSCSAWRSIRRYRRRTIYVSTDQGVYRGHVDELVFDPSVAALAHIPPILGDWTWRRSPGMPYVSVTDLEVQQNFQAHDQSGIVRAGTYGRGVFELNRASTKGPVEKPPLVLSVQAIQRLEDGAPSNPTVQIPVTFEGASLRPKRHSSLLRPREWK